MSREFAPGPATRPEPPISNARLGMLLFVAAEVMLFGGLVAAYVVLRFGSENFHGMQRLPLGLAGINTVVLALSSAMLVASGRGVRRGDRSMARWGALGAFLLGLLFLGLQMLEWNQLMNGGVMPASSVFGGMFYAISWAHAIHVLGGIVLLAVLAIKTFSKGDVERRRNLVAAVAIYWHFVTIMWVGLFVMMFLL